MEGSPLRQGHMKGVRILPPVSDHPRRPLGAEPPPPVGAVPPTPPQRPFERSGARRGLPEPPALRTDPLTSPRACVNCATPLSPSPATPRCWGCGRALCADCYWRHGLVPSAHRCTSCLVATPPDPDSVSGGRVTRWRKGFTPAAPSTNRG
jgi:hypothetical protein